MNSTLHIAARSRAAFSLIELISVLVVLGLMAAAIASQRTSPKLLERQRVKQETQYLSTALRSARTTAIANGQPVRLDSFQKKSASGFVTTIQGVSAEQQPPVHDFPTGLKSEWSSRSVTFNPDGTADTSLSIVLSRPDATSVVQVYGASGQVTAITKE